MVTSPIVDQIGRYNVAKALGDEPPFRNHLGGSMIGKPCERELWYSFRWSQLPKFDGRMYRLFDRGHKEEFRFVDYLLGIGMEVREYSQRLVYHPEFDSYFLADWESDDSAECLDVTHQPYHVERAGDRGVRPKQWRISDVDQHFGGSLDGMATASATTGPIQLDAREVLNPGEWILLEFKTHNTKSFCNLVAKGVKEAKPVHWVQMQTYMFKHGLSRALYVAVNKNDDDLYTEVVHLDPTVGPEMVAKAERVIRAATPPQRIGKHPSWIDCKFCEFSNVCHYGEPLHKSCRTCVHSVPAEKGEWHCNLWKSNIPGDAVALGCDHYKMITD